ncbi:MAG TPA: hypothetical protein ENJ18_14635 [Nannocystis exedens]|nr:hypothetical protein [Nannocystis exedens]
MAVHIEAGPDPEWVDLGDASVALVMAEALEYESVQAQLLTVRSFADRRCVGLGWWSALASVLRSIGARCGLGGRR